MHEARDVIFDGLRARVVQPSDTNGAGILQLPAWAGIGKGTDQYAQWLADQGFTVLTWDPFAAYPEDRSMEDRRRITMGELLDVNRVLPVRPVESAGPDELYPQWSPICGRTERPSHRPTWYASLDQPCSPPPG